MTAPLRFALVPIVATPEMIAATRSTPWTIIPAEHLSALHKTMIAASSGNDLLMLIVAELNMGRALVLNLGYHKSVARIDALLNELGGGDG